MSQPQKFTRILVATDFSKHANAALEQAVWLARQTNASVTLAHTLPDLRKTVHGASTKAKLDLLCSEGNLFEREVRQESNHKMRQQIAQLQTADMNIACETLLGEPFVELTHAVQQEGYDLLLAGTRGLTTWEQFFVGSTAKRLIRKCPCSVWIVKAEHVHPPRSILLATDFSSVSTKALCQALSLAEAAQAELHVLHVVDALQLPTPQTLTNASSQIMQQELSQLQNAINYDAQLNMKNFLKLLPTTQVKVQSHIAWGTPWHEIARLAQEIRADMLVIGTIGRTGLPGLLLGNTAEKLLDACPCSILAVKPDGFVLPITPAAVRLHP
jgi:universal stress protein E